MANIPRNVAKEVTDKFSVKNNTFSRAVKDNPKDKIELEIGDSKQPDFKPQWKFMRWQNEVNFSLRAEEDEDAVVETVGEKVRYKHRKFDVEMFEEPEAGEDGGFTFQWVFNSKPDTNVLTATINTKELELYYQPPLTQEEIDKGASRPDNVIGSYAAYHKTKGGMNRADGMEYKTGKAFHLFRMEATDANGNKVWCDYNVNLNETGMLEITIPQSFLDTAVYPVTVK